MRIEPVLDHGRQPAARLATVVVEQQLGPVRATPGTSDTFTMFTSLVPVSLRTIGGIARRTTRTRFDSLAERRASR